MYGGHAVAATGHCHPRLTKALQEQVGRLLFYSNVAHLEHQEEAAALLTEALPKPLSRAFFVNSGTEAVENAIKVARKATGRQDVLAFEHGFHGRTLGSLGATGLAKYRTGAGIDMPGYAFAPFGDLDRVASLLKSGAYAAVILEPVQSLAGVKTAEAEFFLGLRDLCDAHGTLLIYDELQTGGGRAGGGYAFAPRYGVVPDLMTLGKGIASGVPMGACVMTEALAQLQKPGDLGTTFGGGPLATLALKTTLEILRDERVYEHVTNMELRLREGLSHLPSVKTISGVGLLLGIHVHGPAVKVQKALFEAGVIAGTSEDPNVLRIMPPLTISKENVDLFVRTLGDVEL
jgi:acetylornithine aminotransferase/acetylornithine/N-succinyldiaminopimelate aminotransferase